VSTLVVYSDTSDGVIDSADGYDDEYDGWDGDYAVTRSGTGVVLEAVTGLIVAVGQLGAASFYWVFWVYEGFLGFDTSSIPDTDTVSAAVLRVTSYADYSTTDFDIQARLRDWGTTVTTADWVAGADLSGLTLLGSYATSGGFTATTGYDLSDTAMAANVSKTGSTRMLLCSSRTTNNNAPTGAEYVNIYSADETGTTRDPKLTVTYAAGGSTDYTQTNADSLSTTAEAAARVGVFARREHRPTD